MNIQFPDRHHAARLPVYADAGNGFFPWTKAEAKSRLRLLDDFDPKLAVAKVQGGVTIDYSWLTGASETYQISPNIKDYVLTEVPIVTVDIPNRNLHSFPYEEVSYFDPRFGQFIYKTFVGKPTFSDHCFPAGTLIRTKDDKRMPIEELKVGDEVLTDKGRYRKVTEIFRNGVKKVWKLKVTGLIDPIEMTANHPVLVVDRRQVFGLYSASKQAYQKRLRQKDFRNLELTPHFRSASDVYRGDYLCVPINIGGNVTIDSNFAFLAGAYLADGYLITSPKYPTGLGIGFTIGKTELKFKEKIVSCVEALGLNPCIYEDASPGCVWIFVHNKEFADQIFSCCGRYSEAKRIQGQVRNWSVESMKVFLGAYMSGDGCFDHKKGSFRVRSSCKDLLKDLQQAFAYVGIPACVGIDAPLEKRLEQIKRRKTRCTLTTGLNIIPKYDSGYLRVNQRFIPELKEYITKDIDLKPSLHDGGYGIINNSMLLLPVISVDKDVREAEVLNLEVEEDHTYIANDIIVHNCNKNFVKAKGVHFDSSLRRVPGWNIWKIYVLIGYDRTKDPVLAQQILRGQRRGYSMGAWVSYFLNSISGQISNGSQPLKYPKGTVVNGVLSYDHCTGVEYFETSSVPSPADVSAESHQLWYF